MAEKKQREALLTKRDLLEALESFEMDQPIRVAVSAIEGDDFDGAGAYQLSANVHEYGMLNNHIWSDGWATHATINLSLIPLNESVNHKIPKKYFVNKDKDDPNGERDYW